MMKKDDTTEVDPQPQTDLDRTPDSYYYDDATGYETYEPENASDEEQPDE